MAAGVPVVACAVGGIPEVVTDGVSGLLVAPGDKATLERHLRTLLIDRTLAARIGAAARESARLRFAPERVARQARRDLWRARPERARRRAAGDRGPAKGGMKAPTVLVLGPDRGVISGVATHLNLLLGSALARRFNLVHFQVGSEGRKEGGVGMLARLIASPFRLAAAIARTGASIVHLNPSLDPKAYWRDLPHLLAAKLCGARVVYQIHGGAPSLLCGSNRLLSASDAPRAARDPAVAGRRGGPVARGARGDARAGAGAGREAGAERHRLRAVRRHAHRRRSPLRIFHIGRLVKTKGLVETVQGLALARARGVDARLVIAGDGPD